MSGLRTKRLRYGAAAVLASALLCLGSATAWADEPIVIDFVRHGQSIGDVQNLMDTTPPGTDLTAVGQSQAQTVAEALAQQGSYAGIYASELVRTQETAQYLADALNNMSVEILPGLNEINAGIFAGQPVGSPEGLFYLLAPMAWVLGAEFVPIPGSTEPNGIVFDETFGNAVQTIYDNTVSAVGSNPADVAFSSAGAMATWALMNVNNPDFGLVFDELLTTGQLLPNGGVVVVQGDPQDGWTMVSYDGQPVPQDPGLPTELFVNVRNLIEAPQFAAYNIYEATLSTLAGSVQGATANLGADLSVLLPDAIGAALASL